MAHMFVPGPVDVAPEVLQAMAQPMLPHRSKEYEAIHRSAAEKAQKIFYTQYRVFIGTHSGSGMQETGIRNLVEKDVLCCVNGAFSQRWYEVAVSNGKTADHLDFDWGKAVDPDALRDALKKKHYEAVTIVHNETSTGVESRCRSCAKWFTRLAPIHSSWWMLCLPWLASRSKWMPGALISCSLLHKNASPYPLVWLWPLPLTAP